MAAYTSFGTRKALGRRYAVDPALMLESERLAQEYALMPGREARAQQESQFGRSLEQQRYLQEEAGKQAAVSGMIGTVGNVAQTAALVRAMTMAPGASFWGGSAAVPTGLGATAAGLPSFLGTGAPIGITPSLIDAGTLTAAGATTTTAAPAASSGFLTPASFPGGISAGAPAAGLGMQIGLPAAAGYLGGRLGIELGERIKEIPGGRSEQSTVGGAAAGAAAGAYLGTIGGLPGMAAGAVLGGAVGWVGEKLGLW